MAINRLFVLLFSISFLFTGACAEIGEEEIPVLIEDEDVSSTPTTEDVEDYPSETPVVEEEDDLCTNVRTTPGCTVESCDPVTGDITYACDPVEEEPDVHIVTWCYHDSSFVNYGQISFATNVAPLYWASINDVPGWRDGLMNCFLVTLPSEATGSVHVDVTARPLSSGCEDDGIGCGWLGEAEAPFTIEADGSACPEASYEDELGYPVCDL